MTPNSARSSAEVAEVEEAFKAQRSAVAIVRPLLGIVREPSLFLSVIVILLALTAAFFPTLLATHDPFASNTIERLQAPGLTHLFGTDYIGRDIFSRVVHGAALSLAATSLAVGLAFFVGSAIGLLAGFAGGFLEDILMRIVDVMLAIPSLMLSLMIVTALGSGTWNVAIAVGIAAVAAFARIMRAEVLRVRNTIYIEAARGNGVRWFAILWRHVLPNSSGPVISLAALEFGQAILAISALSFLGFGAPLPNPEWGLMIAEGRNYMVSAWWLIMLPGSVVMAVVLAANRISRAIDKDQKVNFT